MSRTITALYDSRSEAESARERLSSAVDVSNVDIHEQGGGASSSGSGEQRSWFEKLFVSDDDRATYDEGLRRGSFLLSARVDNEDHADRIIDLLEDTSAVDVDERSESWRSQGWQPQSGSSTFSGSSGTSEFGTSEHGERTVEEERIPIVQEQLNVGKRDVERGGARIRSYVRETPVSEQVTLHDEHVEIERRPVSETLSSTDLNRSDLLQDREIEMRATGEEAIVGKEAHVNEELVVRKTEDEHVENVQDSVRHTEVDVEGDQTSRGAFGFDRDDERSERSTATEFQDENSGRR